MTSSCSSEKLCTSSTATAGGTPSAIVPPAASALRTASVGRIALPPPCSIGLPNCVVPVELVARDQRHPWLQLGDRGPHRRMTSSRARPMAVGSDRVTRRAPIRECRRHRAGRRRRRSHCGPRFPWCPANRCRSRRRPATARRCPCWPTGRRDALPAAWRKVARRSRVTNASTTVAPPAAGQQVGERGDEPGLQRPARLVDDAVGRRHGDRQVLTLCWCSPDGSVRSKNHCTGERTAAANGRSVTRRS